MPKTALYLLWCRTPIRMFSFGRNVHIKLNAIKVPFGTTYIAVSVYVITLQRAERRDGHDRTPSRLNCINLQCFQIVGRMKRNKKTCYAFASDCGPVTVLFAFPPQIYAALII